MADNLETILDDSRAAGSNETTNPTFYGTIQGLFIKNYRDIMKNLSDGDEAFAFDLWNYDEVRKRAAKVYDVLNSGFMPKEPYPKFTPTEVSLVRTWITQGYQKGTPPPANLKISSLKTTSSPTRLRKNIETVVQDPIEFGRLKDAFRRLLADDESYRRIVQIHADYCYHNSQLFFPWHRPYIILFEDELRRVAQDDTITLPYWDFTSGKIPDVFFEAPFNHFSSKSEFPSAKYDEATQTYVTQRNSAKDISDGYTDEKVAEHTRFGYAQPIWERFTGWYPRTSTLKKATMNAHNQGHNQVGVTMQNSLYSPFDPIFWFYHCNWDRVLWGWQTNFNAIHRDNFAQRLMENGNWLTEGGGLGLVPFQILSNYEVQAVDQNDQHLCAASVDVLDNTLFGVAYDNIPNVEISDTPLRISAGIAVHLPFNLSDHALVEVNNLNRIEIEGNFNVSLYADGRLLDRLSFLQATQPRECPNCVSRQIVNFEFTVLTADITGKALHVKITNASDGSEIDPFTIGVPEIVVKHGFRG
eukprot:CAMPEP_0117551868 /NCGR_PEP_ID=MMETSP0784-20121206/49411_1 /TAXON_ID=39447 /ORGANISM="" /LENGTH=527 /DNA_ID=CAMNT_0005348917 /DNA_START=110 /DNA_END=1693 /DNA_ORIENTATION=+